MSDSLVYAPRADQPTLPNPWLRLPATVASLVADPSEWGFLQGGEAGRGIGERIAGAAADGRLQVTSPVAIGDLPSLPSLAPKEQSLPPWKRAAVDRCDAALGQPVPSKVEFTALRAGILQMGDFLTPSHECSQSIEGQGKRQAGDYWHAIHHRREPDYGNAKYWFRRVGKHPLLGELPKAVSELAREFSPGIQSRAVGLVEGGLLNPFQLVDLVSDASRGRDEELTRFAERLQWIEMVGLMEWTVRDATT